MQILGVGELIIRVLLVLQNKILNSRPRPSVK
jgi:hypothetical protein